MAHAKKSGDDKKMQVAASKKKKMEDRAGLEKNDKGHRFRRNKCALFMSARGHGTLRAEPGWQMLLRRDMGGYHNSLRRDVVLDAPELAAAWKLPEPAELRTRGPLIQLDAVSFAFPQPALSGQPPHQASSPAPPTQRTAAAAAKEEQPTAKRKWLLSNVTMCVEQVGHTLAQGAMASLGPAMRLKMMWARRAPGWCWWAPTGRASPRCCG